MLSSGLGFILGCAVMLIIQQQVLNEARPVAQSKAQLSEIRTSFNYKFINPLLECDDFAPSDLAKLKGLKTQLNNCISSRKAVGEVTDVAVYFRDLNNGPWIGINEHQAFSPASMLKVPIMMAVLKQAELNPGFIDKQVTLIVDDFDEFIPNIGDEITRVGDTYAIREWIHRMIVFSDNNAKNLLLRQLSNEQTNKGLWNSLGLSEPDGQTAPDFLSVKDYSGFFRLLYNATYLSKENSEWALEQLSKTRFQKGIRAVTPQNVQVASKFGERGQLDSDVKQLHECGIVYLGSSPFLICVMTRGKDWDVQASVIQEIAGIVYANR
jgi:beta-lactamase class A